MSKLNASGAGAGGMIHGWRGQFYRKWIEPKLGNSKTDMSSVVAWMLLLAVWNENDKVVIRYAFSSCVQCKNSSRHYCLPLDMKSENRHQTVRGGSYEGKEVRAVIRKFKKSSILVQHRKLNHFPNCLGAHAIGLWAVEKSLWKKYALNLSGTGS